MKKYKKVTITMLAILLVPVMLIAGYFDSGCRYYMYRNYEKAREMFFKDIDVRDHGDAYYFLGEIEKKEGNLDKAEEYFAKALERPMTLKYKKLAYWNIIVLLEEKRDYGAMVARCIEFYEKLNETSARSKVESLINKLLWTENDSAREKFKLGNSLKRKDSKKALEAFRDALSYDSGFLAARFEIGMYYYNRDMYSDALGYFKDIADKIPFYGEVNLLIGNIYFSKRYYRDAAYYFDRAIQYSFISNKTESSIRMKRATCYYHTRDYDKAIEDLDFVRKYRKGSIKPLLLLSALQIKQEQYDDAIENLQRAHRLNRNNREVLFQLGSLYYRTEDKKFVSYFKKLFNHYSKKKPDETPSKYIKAFRILANAEYENENYNDVISIINWLPDNSLNYDMRRVLAHSCYNTGKYQDAIDNFEKISLSTDDSLVLCKAYAKAGFTDKAVTLLKSLYYNYSVRDRAREDQVLKKIAAEIESREKQDKEDQEKDQPIKQEKVTPVIPDKKDKDTPETTDTNENAEDTGDIIEETKPGEVPETGADKTADKAVEARDTQDEKQSQ